VPTTACFPQIRVDIQRKPIDVSFDAPMLSSDGGLLLLGSADRLRSVTESVASRLPAQPVGRNARHTTLDLVRQRVLQIASGYEDANDATRLRLDPLLRVAVGRTLDEALLASQPTLSRFENGVSLRDVVKLQRDHERRYVESLPSDLEVLVLDIDGTDDPTHGQQELAFYNSHYDSTIYAPLMIFDQDGRLASARMRPGNKFLAHFAGPMLERIVRRVRESFPRLPILVRGDAAFAVASVINRLDRLTREVGQVDYLIGVYGNKALQRGAAPSIAIAELCAKQRGRTSRAFDMVIYQAETWDHAHHVIVKAEHDGRRATPRFVITTLLGATPSRLYDAVYCRRGDAENRIKDFKNALAADRLSCHRFVANALRLQLHAAAYELCQIVREHAVGVIEKGLADDIVEPLQESQGSVQPMEKPRRVRWQFDTMRDRLFKVAAMVRQSVRRIEVALPRAFPFAALFHEVLHSLAVAAPR
jgi:hypothetical protein